MILQREVILFLCTDEDICIDSVPIIEVSMISLDPHHDNHNEKCFKINTRPGGLNSGAVFLCRVHSDAACQTWMGKLQMLTKKHAVSSGLCGCRHSIRQVALAIDESDVFPSVVAFLIVANFVLIITEAQLVPEDGSKEKEIFRWLDVFFTSMFVLEILVRFVAHVGLEFIKDGWNVCDLIIVSFSVVQIIITDIIEVNQLRLLRFFRVLRVLRIFGKLQQLRHIVSSITKAVIPVRDAIFIVLMVAFMYAIIGVDSYGSTSPGNLFLLPFACIRANGIVLSYLDLDFMS